MIVFRQADPRYPFLWSDASQPAGRWHGEGEGPVHYFADTPDGAWAELVRHEEIREPEDLGTIRRALWAVEIEDGPTEASRLPRAVLTGGVATYPACRRYAMRERASGTRRLVVPSAALLPGGASGHEVVEGLERAATARDGRVLVIFGAPEGVTGWKAVERGGPPTELLPRVRHFPD